MAAIIKLSQNEWVKFFFPNGWEGSVSEVFFVQMVGTNPGKCEWVWEEKLRWLNPRGPNWRWLPSSNWVRMNEFESDWISLSQSFVQNGWIQDGRIQDGSHHQVNQIELVWVRVEGECFWVNLREDKKMSESKMAVSESNMVEFKMAAIIKLRQNEWVKFFVQMVGTNLGKCEWVWEEKLRWLNPRGPNWRWLPSSNWVRMNEFESDWISLSQSFVQNGWIQDGRIQDESYHQVNQIELVWFRVEGECFWVNLREDKKVSESKMAVSESNMVEFKMAAIIKLSQNEWVKFFSANGWEGSVSEVFLCKWWEPILASVSEFERKI